MKKNKNSLSFRRCAALLLCICLVSGLAACGKEKPAETKKSEPAGLYALSDSGEAIVNDVDFAAFKQTDDNARVFYEIFVGSFSDSNGDGVGDLRGIINRFDYLNDGDPKSGESLGIEGIWLSPIFKSPSYHKYDVTDYYTIDEQFGTMDDLKELASLCEERGVKLILDLVINHTGSQNEWFKNFESAHRHKDESDEYYDFYSYNDSIKLGNRVFYPIPAADEFYQAPLSRRSPVRSTPCTPLSSAPCPRSPRTRH